MSQMRWNRYVMAAAALGLAACGQSAPRFDVIVRGGELIDGRGSPRARADVGANGDRIVALGDLSGATAATVIDATGRVVSPGFIDVQGQSGTTLLIDGNGESHLRQGITSEIIGEGDSPAFWSARTASPEALARAGQRADWTTFDEYLSRLTTAGIALNLGTLIPATLVRSEVVGLENRPPTPAELTRMEQMVERAMEDGAFGLASALIYMPGSFASTEELIALAKVAGAHRGIYVSHIRGESFNLFNALDEALRIGKEGSLPVVIFHLKVAARANWGRMGEALAKLQAAAAAGQKVSATMYPYAAGGTRLAAVLPLWAQEGGTEAMLARLADPAQRARMRKEVETTTDGWENLLMGATFDGVQVASVPPEDRPGGGGEAPQRDCRRAQGRPVGRALRDHQRHEGARGRAVPHDERGRRAHGPSGAVCVDRHRLRRDSDGGPLAQGQPHPRAYGTFPRVLGKYVRADRAMTLEEAVRRMTSLAAEQFQIRDRGVIREGVEFADSRRVRSGARSATRPRTNETPHKYPTGIDFVVVNGTPMC